MASINLKKPLDFDTNSRDTALKIMDRKVYNGVSLVNKIFALPSITKYHIMNETSGLTAKDYSVNDEDGTYESMTLADRKGIDGRVAPTCDGLNDRVIIDTNLNTYADTAKGSVLVAVQFPAAAWIDGIEHGIWSLHIDATNKIRASKRTDNALRITWRGSGNANVVNYTFGTAPTDWFIQAYTWSDDNVGDDETKLYINGSLEDTDNCAKMTGAFSSGNIGKLDFGRWMVGGLCHYVLSDEVWTAPQIANIKVGKL